MRENKTGPAKAQMDRSSVLLVEDERSIREPLAKYFHDNGFIVGEAGNASEARKLLGARAYDVAILDIIMPGESGIEFFRYISDNHRIPVIFLTALSDDIDRIVGLELGADDYVTKPFNPRELLARVRVLLRRTARESLNARGPDRRAYGFGSWILDGDEQVLLHSDGSKITLTASEYALISTLVRKPRAPFTRDYLLDQIRGRTAGPFDRSIDNVVARLRKKVEIHAPIGIKTVWGIGYMLNLDVKEL